MFELVCDRSERCVVRPVARRSRELAGELGCVLAEGLLALLEAGDAAGKLFGGKLTLASSNWVARCCASRLGRCSW